LPLIKPEKDLPAYAAREIHPVMKRKFSESRFRVLLLSYLSANSRRRFAAEALQERWEKISEALLVIRIRVNLSLWRKFVDDLWQVFGQKMRGLGGIHAKLCSESIDLVRTKGLLNLAARNWLVFSHADPGGKCVPLAAL
jgi:hypothetical protein